jgi:hypothetical protein
MEQVIKTKSYHTNHCLIPIQVCDYCIRNRISRALQIYLLLKAKSRGVLTIDEALLQELAFELKLKTTRTITNNLKKLIKLNFIGFNKRHKIYHLRGFHTICSYYKFKLKGRFIFDIQEIKKLKAFLIASILSYLIFKNVYRRRLKEFNSGNSPQLNRRPISYEPVANSLFANYLGFSNATAFKYKKLAAKANYIRIRKNIQMLKWSKVNKREYIKYFPENAMKLRVINNMLAICEADEILSCVKYKKVNKKKGKKVNKIN